MKKSVILILIAVYVVSIGVVGFFGLHVRFYEPNILPEKIEVTQLTYLDKSVDLTLTENEGQSYKKATINYRDGDALTVEIRYVVTPDNATNKKVIYELKTTNKNIEISEDGKIIFTKPQNSNLPLTAVIRVKLDAKSTVYEEVHITVKFGTR